MDSQLFAFRMAKPVETAEPLTDAAYDPQRQTMVWSGTGHAAASLYCTSAKNHPSGCNGYAFYCTTWGKTVTNGKKCDST